MSGRTEMGMKWVNSTDVMRYTNKMADFEDHVVIFCNLVPRLLSLPRESTLVTAGHVSARF